MLGSTKRHLMSFMALLAIGAVGCAKGSTPGATAARPGSPPSEAAEAPEPEVAEPPSTHVVIAGEIATDDGKPLPQGALTVELVVDHGLETAETLASYEARLAEPSSKAHYELVVPREKVRDGARLEVRAKVVFGRLVYVAGALPVSIDSDRSSVVANVTVVSQVASLRGMGPESGGFGAVETR
jgi:hypothetical protein